MKFIIQMEKKKICDSIFMSSETWPECLRTNLLMNKMG